MLNTLDKMSVKELEQHLADVKAAIVDARNRARDEAKAAAEKAAAQFGFSLSELTGGKGSRRKAANGAAKYANPQNPTQTWTGKGRRPKWYQDAIVNGTAPEAMEV